MSYPPLLPPSSTTTTTSSRLSLCLLHLIATQGLLLLLTQADALSTHSNEWEREEGTFIKLDKDDYTEEEEEEEEEEEGQWVLEEESVASVTSQHRLLPSVKGRGGGVAVSEVWWEALSPYDPAKGAEPAKWDGWLTLQPPHHNHTHPDPLPPPPPPRPRLPTDYEILQDTWTEDAVT